MNRERMLRTALAVVLATAALAGCRPGASTRSPADGDGHKPERVTLLLNWFPEAEHGGFFAALVHGYYAAEGLDVQILPGGPGASVTPRVATGDVDFGVENADNVLLARAQDAPVVAILAPIQKHPRCIMVHEDSGITSLRELRDLTLAMNAGGAFSHYLKKHVPLAGVKIVPYPGNVARFVADKRYAQQAYVFSEPFLAARQGARPRALLLADIGFNPYTSCLLTCDKTLQTRRSLAQRMARASARGWEQYLKDPAQAHARITQLNPEMDAATLDYGWKALRSLVLTEDAKRRGIGTMDERRWAQLRDQLVEIGLIPAGKVDPARAFEAGLLSESGSKEAQAHGSP